MPDRTTEKSYLIIIPTKIELNPFIHKIECLGYKKELRDIKNVQINYFKKLNIIVALGGLGKTQFGIQTQFYIDNIEDIGRVFCVGAAGNLSEKAGFGDIVIGEKTIEHDINRSSRKLIPGFAADEKLIELIKKVDIKENSYAVFFGNIASGDEDIVNEESRKRVIDKTNAIAVAWEGAGGARACSFNDLPFIEIRGISDDANETTIKDFRSNIKIVMEHLADMVVEICRA